MQPERQLFVNRGIPPQPETIKVTDEDIKVAGKREPSPIEQWDQLAQTLIRQELAPKGFSEIKRGHWRGKVQANIPFLPKQTVDRTGKIAAQLVRAFRSKFQNEVADQIKSCEAQIERWTNELSACGLLQFKKKTECRAKITEYEIKARYSKAIIERLNLVAIK